MSNPFEAARERELYLYYQPPVSSPYSANLTNTPRSSTDTALSAFAQLSTLRLDTRRALISVLDCSQEYILAESTQTLSSQSDLVHDGQDELWFGCSTIPRADGLCERAVQSPTLSHLASLTSSPLIADDISTDARFLGSPFIKNRPSVRFYAAMPIRTKAGFEIGTLAVMDERRRDGLSVKELIFLQDMAITIMDHLEMSRVKEAHRRSEKMVKGLGLFVEGRSHLREWWLDAYNAASGLNSPNLSVKDGSTTSSRHGQHVASPSIMSMSDCETLPSKRDEDLIANVHDKRVDLQESESTLSANLKDMFSRASNIIRECIEVDGSLFLDASINTFGGNSGESHRRFDHMDGTTNQAGERDEKKCGILGFSTGDMSGMEGDEVPESYSCLSESFLHALVKKYPRGQVFDLCEDGSLIPKLPNVTLGPDKSILGRRRPSKTILPSGRGVESPTLIEARTILRMLPGARSVAFSPLWDSHRERFFAASFAWTTRSTRVLRLTEDLNYLAAFGNSIMVDVARQDALAADQAKSDFISSISHELRTPLHGILASVEFLQDTAVDLFQMSMIDTIERCGRTLLDTIQHVLDFAKINFNQIKVKDIYSTSAAQGDTVPKGLSIDIDLSVLTEDVIDSMHAGYEFLGQSSLVSVRDLTPTVQVPPVQKDRVEVIPDIGWVPNWVYNAESGALRRILMNLLGNSLKYTDSGWCKVSLQCQDVETAPQHQQSTITLIVSDSGRGISEEFLQGHLFTPFIQENSMNPGVGLGMSIVRAIVSSLGGRIDVTSEQGVGTEITVSLTMTQVPLLQQPSYLKHEHPAFNARRKTSGLRLGLVGFESPSDSRPENAVPHASHVAASLLQSSIERMATSWFDMTVSSPDHWKLSPPDIYIVNETPQPKITSTGAPTIIICSSASIYRSYTVHKNARAVQNSADGYVYFVSKPCGPHKLAKAFDFCLNTSSKTRGSSTLQGSIPHQSLFGSSPNPSSSESSQSSDEQYQREGYLPSMREGSIKWISKSIPPTVPTLTTSASSETIVAKRRKPMLLLVDDNAINIRLLETFMSKNNFEFRTAVNGLLAVQAFQSAERPFDIIFMDISMPVMDGLQASHKIRTLERDQRRAPSIIIALTGLASASARQDAVSNGINLFLTKPVRFADLRTILNEWPPPDNSKAHLT